MSETKETETSGSSHLSAAPIAALSRSPRRARRQDRASSCRAAPSRRIARTRARYAAAAERSRSWSYQATRRSRRVNAGATGARTAATAAAGAAAAAAAAAWWRVGLLGFGGEIASGRGMARSAAARSRRVRFSLSRLGSAHGGEREGRGGREREAPVALYHRQRGGTPWQLS